MNEQTTKMRQEEKFFARMSSNLKLIKTDLELKQQGLTLESMKLAGIMNKQEDEKAEFRESIFNCLKNLSDYKKLKQGIVDLHKVYVNVKEEEDDSDIRQKQAKQRIVNLAEAHKIDQDKQDKMLKAVAADSRRKAG